jgi:hypothetical protein
MVEERDMKCMGTTKKRRMGVVIFVRFVAKLANKEISFGAQKLEWEHLPKSFLKERSNRNGTNPSFEQYEFVPSFNLPKCLVCLAVSQSFYEHKEKAKQAHTS